MWVLEKGEDRNQKESSNFVCWCAYYQNKWFPPISSYMKEEMGRGGEVSYFSMIFHLSFKVNREEEKRKQGSTMSFTQKLHIKV